jgi:hypothetical protein
MSKVEIARPRPVGRATATFSGCGTASPRAHADARQPDRHDRPPCDHDPFVDGVEHLRLRLGDIGFAPGR